MGLPERKTPPGSSQAASLRAAAPRKWLCARDPRNSVTACRHRAGLENSARCRQPCRMKLPRRAARVPQALASERGFLEIAGRDDGISLREAFLRFRDLVSADMDWADSRKVRFRARAACVKVAALALTAASTVVLGIPAIPGRSPLALANLCQRGVGSGRKLSRQNAVLASQPSTTALS